MFQRIARRVAPFRPSLARLPGSRLRQKLTLALFSYGIASSAIMAGLLFSLLAQWPAATRLSAIVMVLAACVAIFVLHRRLVNYSNGLDAEATVGKRLAGLERSDYRVMHDFEGKGFNIDHILVGPQGVYAVETKFISKLVGRSTQIVYSADKLFLYGKELRSDPVAQSKRCAADLAILLRNKGFAVDVRPIVIIPGWYIDGRGEKADSPWVLELKAVPRWLEKEPSRLSPEEVKRIHYALREVAEREVE